MSHRSEIIAEAISGRSPNSSGFIRINCPFCQDHGLDRDTGRCFGVNADNGVYKCWRCDTKGRLHVDENLSDGYSTYEPPEKFFLPTEALPLFTEEAYQSPDAQPALHYLLNTRGFTKKQLMLSMAHYASHGAWYGRILFPHFYKENLWGWTARSYIGTHQLSKRYPLGMSRDLLYNQEILELKIKKPCFNVESVTSALRLLPHATAFLGQPSDKHIETLVNSRNRLNIIMLDGDRWREGRRLAREIRHAGGLAKAIMLPAGKDPDLMDTAKILTAADYLQNNSDFELDLASKDAL